MSNLPDLFFAQYFILQRVSIFSKLYFQILACEVFQIFCPLLNFQFLEMLPAIPAFPAFLGKQKTKITQFLRRRRTACPKPPSVDMSTGPRLPPPRRPQGRPRGEPNPVQYDLSVLTRTRTACITAAKLLKRSGDSTHLCRTP